MRIQPKRWVIVAAMLATAAASAPAQVTGEVRGGVYYPADPAPQPSTGPGVQEPCTPNWIFPVCPAGRGPGTDADPSGQATPEQIAAVQASLSGAMLQGDQKLACEAILCLASGSSPGECMPSLQRYFSIVFKSWSKTLRARGDFLKLCPISNDSDTAALINSLIGGAGRCDVGSLNAMTTRTGGEDGETLISSTMPAECIAFYGDPNVGAQPPRYVGTPEAGGFWASADEYEAALARYLAGRTGDQAERPSPTDSGS